MKKIQIVDLVRSFSILAVMAHHLGLSFLASAHEPHFIEVLWFKLWANGNLGVPIFFVVSGFLITGVIASGPGGLFQPDFRDFYARRVGRIFPLLALICLIGLALDRPPFQLQPGFDYCLKTPDGADRWTLWFSIVTFTENLFKILSSNYSLSLHWGVLWSLAIEEQFYLFYPLILKKLKNERNLVFFLSVMIVLGPVSLALLSFFWHRYRVIAFNPGSIYNSFAGFSLIAIGCLLYLIVKRHGSYLARAPKDCWYLVLCGLGLIAMVFWHVHVSIDFWWQILDETFLGVGVLCLILGGMHLDFFDHSNWRILALPGKFSYGAYLLHSTILFFLWTFFMGMNNWAVFLVFSISVTAVTALSFYFYEMPMNRWVRKSLGSKTKV